MIDADGGAGWRIVELEPGVRVVIDPDGTIVGSTDAEPTAVLTTPVVAPDPVPTVDQTAATPASTTPATATQPDATTQPSTTTPTTTPDGGLLGSVTSTVLTTATGAVSTVATTAGGTIRDLAAAVIAPISFDTGGIGQLATTLKTAADAIEKELDQLADVGRSLRGKWSGTADDAFRTAHHEWSQRLDALRRILKDSSSLANEVEDSLVRTESKIQDLWG
jgi:WXG100 family type VII secretion target